MKFALTCKLPNAEKRMQSAAWLAFKTDIERARLKMRRNEDPGYAEWADQQDVEDIKVQDATIGSEITVPCELCGTPTRMLGTKRCDGCWEIERRINHQPELARKILTARGEEQELQNQQAEQLISEETQC